MATVASSSVALSSSYRKPFLPQTLIASILSLAIGLYFWTDSRYPSLLKKLHSGKSIRANGALSFDAIWPVAAGMSLFTRIEHTTVNWLWTNRIGMTFGICFGAAMLTLLSTLPLVRFRNAAGNTLLGALTGIPLGVCANCVAPIGRGMFTAGASSDTVLATMISSPTLNVIVLAMAFTLFPVKIALVRLFVPLILLAFVPLMVRYTTPQTGEGSRSFPIDVPPQTVGQTLFHYLKNLARLAYITIPLMIVAAALGAAIAELLPAQDIPAHVSLMGIVIVALIGTFLPVPMSFDVAAAFILMMRGVPMPYVVTLLCTLGAFSIYPMLIMGRTISWRTAMVLFAAVMFLGVLAGVGTGIAQHSF